MSVGRPRGPFRWPVVAEREDGTELRLFVDAATAVEAHNLARKAYRENFGARPASAFRVREAEVELAPGWEFRDDGFGPVYRGDG